MSTTRTISKVYGFLVGFLVSRSAALDFTGFEPIEDIPQDFHTIQFGLECPSDFVGRATSMRYNVEPNSGSEVIISTSPPDLVDAIVENGVLSFQYNEVSLVVHPLGAGVLIQVPQDQLVEIRGAPSTSFSAQVFQGFSRFISIVQESEESNLAVYMKKDSPLKYVDRGRANGLAVFNSVRASVDISGKTANVIIDGIVESGELSGTNSLIWASQAINQLTVSGSRNRIFTLDGDGSGCDNVEFLATPNVCDLTTTGMPAPSTQVTSTAEVVLNCREASDDEDGRSASDGAKLFWAVAAVCTMQLALLF